MEGNNAPSVHLQKLQGVLFWARDFSTCAETKTYCQNSEYIVSKQKIDATGFILQGSCQRTYSKNRVKQKVYSKKDPLTYDVEWISPLSPGNVKTLNESEEHPFWLELCEATETTKNSAGKTNQEKGGGRGENRGKRWKIKPPWAV